MDDGQKRPKDDSATDDVTLMRQAQDDPASFAALYRRHLHSVYRYLLSRTGNVQDAQDLTSRTFVAALESIDSFRGEGSVVAWLLSIARHKMQDHYRRARPLLPLDAARDVVDPGARPDEDAGEKLRLQRLAQALAALSPDRAEALALRIFGGLSVVEVAQVTGKSEAAVRMLVYRATQDLRVRLAPNLEAKHE